MNAYAFNLEMAAIQTRTRKMLILSLVFHALLFLWLGLRHTILPSTPTLTEITWLDPAGSPPPAAGTEMQSRRLERGPIAQPRASAEERFVRRTGEGDFAPRPQDRDATEDVLKRRVASLERTAMTSQASIADIASPRIPGRASLAGIPSSGYGTSGGVPGGVALSRGSGGYGGVAGSGTGTGPIGLVRSAPRRAAPAALPASVPEKKAAPAAMARSEASTRRIVAGASLTGPVADRPLVSYRKPDYPDWAKSDGVEATLTLYFIVLPGGAVKENVLVEKTSGFEDFDQNAIVALREWRFAALKSGETGEQWGSITFNYRLTD